MNCSDLVLAGDCGGTNTRLSLWQIPRGSSHKIGDIAPGEVLFAKKYVNEEHSSFVDVCELFLRDAKVEDKIPAVSVLACAGPILNNTVEYVGLYPRSCIKSYV